MDNCLSLLLLLVLTITSGILITDLHAVQLSSGKLNNDFEDLRVSSHQLLDPAVNYHSIRPQDDHQQSRTIPEQLTNHIGKPLVALPQRPDIAQQRSTVSANGLSRRIKYNDATGDSGSKDQVVRMTIRKNMRPSGACQWMSLQEFKNVSLVTSELIIRDNEGEPSYILTIRGSIKRDNNSYFALNTLQVHPEASKIFLSGQNTGSRVNLSLNCLTNLKNEGGFSLPAQRLGSLFEEKIVLLSECGYLVLRLQINGLYLALKSISFYRNLDAVSQDPQQKRRSRQPSRAIPSMQSEHLVFSNEGTQSYPLFVIPITSRYNCQNRIVLTGKNSVQLELSMFELRRLAYPTFRGSNSNSNEDIDQISTIHPPLRLTKRDTDSLTRRNPSSSVARCPTTAGPLTSLTFMMDPMVIKRNYDTLNQAVADKWISKNSSGSSWAGLELNLRGGLVSLSYILSIYLAKHLLDGPR